MRAGAAVKLSAGGFRVGVPSSSDKAGVIVTISTFAAFEPGPLFPTSFVFRAVLSAFTKHYAYK